MLIMNTIYAELSRSIHILFVLNLVLFCVLVLWWQKKNATKTQRHQISQKKFNYKWNYIRKYLS